MQPVVEGWAGSKDEWFEGISRKRMDLIGRCWDIMGLCHLLYMLGNTPPWLHLI